MEEWNHKRMERFLLKDLNVELVEKRMVKRKLVLEMCYSECDSNLVAKHLVKLWQPTFSFHQHAASNECQRVELC